MTATVPGREPDDERGDAEAAGLIGAAADRRRETRSPRLGRRLRTWLSWHLVGLFAAVFPYLYVAYCWLVWRTSHVRDDGDVLEAGRARHGRAVALLWHQEVFTVAYSYRRYHGHTLASMGNFGRIITRMLERCNFTVFRGGSSSGTARRRGVVKPMIEHMLATPGVIYGITVDGSKGPALRLKPGGVLIAKACRAPIFLARAHCSRRLELPTWDRTAIPLPFGRIHLWMVGPYWIAPDASDEEFAATVAHLERELQELYDLGHREVERRPRTVALGRALRALPRECATSLREVPELRSAGGAGSATPLRGMPEAWQPRWPTGTVGLPRGPHDLRPDDPPPWASKPGELSPAPAEADGGAGDG